jgi:hypothetical protein
MEMKRDGSLQIQICGKNQYGIHSLNVFRGTKPVFTALVSEGEIFACWYTTWVTDFDGYERHGGPVNASDPEGEVRKILGGLVAVQS